ncbi:phage integrase central domain-containing protein [Sphingomonas sanguinis]|uniref:phage integrase central domain-containing protein n=1 Tax=Sphingomonas sanguinis TaxID=33051 RepID=UPI003A0FE6E8
MSGSWKNRRHVSWLSSIENHVLSEIGTKEVLLVLEPIWLTIPGTARRILQRIGVILEFAYIKGYIPAEVALRSVTRGLPKQRQQFTHRAAMAYAEVPAFWSQLVAEANSVAGTR